MRKLLVVLSFCLVFAVSCASKKFGDKMYGWTCFPYSDMGIGEVVVDPGSFRGRLLDRITASATIQVVDGVIIGDTKSYGYFGENDVNISTPEQVVLANAKYELIRQALEMNAGFMTGFNYICKYDQETGCLTATVSALAFAIDHQESPSLPDLVAE